MQYRIYTIYQQSCGIIIFMLVFFSLQIVSMSIILGIFIFKTTGMSHIKELIRGVKTY